MLATLVTLCLLVVSGAFSAAIDQGPLTSSPDVHTSYLFPDFPSQKLPSGELIEVLLGFANKGQNTFKITHLGASLNHPQDFRYYIQNYTKFEYDVLVHPNEHVSLAYRFRPDALLEPREFGLIVSVYYHDELGGNFTTAFFNGTIDIVDPDNGFDFQQAFIYLGLFAIVGLGGFFWLSNFGKENQVSEKETHYTLYRSWQCEQKYTNSTLRQRLVGRHTCCVSFKIAPPTKERRKKETKVV